MPLPRKSLIAANLETTLRGMTVPPYSYAFMEVKRLQRGPFNPSMLPAAAVYLPHEEPVVPEMRGNIGLEDMIGQFVVEVWKNENVPGYLDEELMVLCADVYKAIIADTTRGGLALQTLYNGCDLLLTDASENEGGLDMYFMVQYRHFVGDMTS